MGSDESHFNISVGSDGHRTLSTNHNLSEEKGEPKRYQVLPLTSLTPYRWAKPAHILRNTVVKDYVLANDSVIRRGYFALIPEEHCRYGFSTG